MKKHLFLFVALVTFATTISAQSDTTRGTFLKPKPRNYEVKHAIEIESLVPMFSLAGCFIFSRVSTAILEPNKA